MQQFSTLKQITDPTPEAIGNSVEEFLRFLEHPSCIRISGQNNQIKRAIVTLLHGNEPSGLKAIFQWLKLGIKPAADILSIIASVPTALIEPHFSHRNLPGEQDLNRCFNPKLITTENAMTQLATAIMNELTHFKPEAILDIHNTSGAGPSFGVVTHMDLKHNALTSLFTQQLIVTDLRLGALMEISELSFPTVTIEVGGRLDQQADQLAFAGLQRFFTLENLFSTSLLNQKLDILHNPIRCELAKGTRLLYAEKPQAEYDVILKPNIEIYNSNIAPKNTHLGWIGDKGLTSFFCRNHLNENLTNEYLYQQNQKLLLAKDLRLFMATTNTTIATTDCAFYATPADQLQHL